MGLCGDWCSKLVRNRTVNVKFKPVLSYAQRLKIIVNQCFANGRFPYWKHVHTAWYSLVVTNLAACIFGTKSRAVREQSLRNLSLLMRRRALAGVGTKQLQYIANFVAIRNNNILLIESPIQFQ